MDFAESALEAVKGKEATAANTLILVQSGSEQHRIEANAGFKNVIEVMTHDEKIAKEVAQAIFKFKR